VAVVGLKHKRSTFLTHRRPIVGQRDDFRETVPSIAGAGLLETTCLRKFKLGKQIESFFEANPEPVST